MLSIVNVYMDLPSDARAAPCKCSEEYPRAAINGLDLKAAKLRIELYVQRN